MSIITSSDGFDKKIVKLYKALRLMEQAKHIEPKYSDYFTDLAKVMDENRRKSSDNVSRLSSMGGQTDFQGTGFTNVFG
jgi:hypothetical protein